ncbi:Nramp family divalent metal transporter [Caproicibacter sp.]|uniref:Nramp family divalent metal transporter n=1 Tax=Caproicibacter sp. TaxID=2814884 RepID=UPI00398A41FF
MEKLKYRIKNIGPGALVAAAFIGPGTVTTCIKAGAGYGYTLLWALLFSTIATMILQEMSARLGIISQKGLGENIREKVLSPVLKSITVVIIILAVFVGNIAYETGNLVGGALGINTVVPSVPVTVWAPILAALAFLLLWSGSYNRIEKVLIALVLIMSVVFLVTALMSRPDWGAVLKGLFVPATGKTGWMTVIGLIGTTVVPYNLFLHASSASERWKNVEDLKSARIDTVVSIGLGGLISMAIVVAASANLYGTGNQVANGADMAKAFHPILGSWSGLCLGIGLFASGFTSAITAPLAAAFATSGVLGFGKNMKDLKFKGLWIVVLAFGMVLSALGKSSPTQIILLAQAANAIILPVVALFLMYCMNHRGLGRYKNGALQNILGSVVIVVTLLICIRNLTSFFSSLFALV